MSRVAFRLLIIAVALCSWFAVSSLAQTPSPSPAPESTKTPEAKPENAQPENPFAPEPAQPLPPGMTGSDAADPRAKLSPGVYDAAETSSGIKHILLLKKPSPFQLGSDNPEDPKVQ